MTALRLEWFKLRRRGCWLITLSMGLVSLLWSCPSLFQLSESDRSMGYACALFFISMINTIVLPLGIAVLAGRICEMEHRGSTYKLLFTLQRPIELLRAKLVLLFLHLVLLSILQGGGVLLIGRLLGFTEPIPVSVLHGFMVSTLLVSAVLAALVALLSLSIANGFLPLFVGLGSSLVGLMALLLDRRFMYLVPSGYYGLLSGVVMDWNEATGIVRYHYESPAWFTVILPLVALAVLIVISRAAFYQKEV